MTRTAIAALLLQLALSAGAGEAGRELIANGGFERIGSDGVPAHWGLPAGIALGADHSLRLEATPKQHVHHYRLVPLDGATAVRFSARMRCSGVERGDEPWHDARIILDFKDAAGATVGPGLGHPNLHGTQDWRTVTLVGAVPANAVALALMPSLFMAKAGVFEIDDLSLTAIDPATLPAEKKAATIVIDGGKPVPPMLRVAGNRLVDPAGAEAWVQGVNVPSLGWSNTGDGIALASCVAAIEGWKSGCIRLAVDAHRWAGTAEGQSDGGTAYRALVDDCIRACVTRGAYVVLDLHHYRAPRDSEVAFWTSAALVYKDHPAVLFGLLNEPHDIDWKTWRDGGMVDEGQRGGDGVIAENQQVVTGFRTIGMQGLIDVVRGVGARNVVVVGGLDWGYDLSGVIDGFALDDPNGNGVVYDTHIYYWKDNWQRCFLAVAAKHPVLVGEVGCMDTPMSFIPKERFEDPYTWAPDMIACIQKHRLNWTAWSFHTSATPALLGDLDTFAPNACWGAFVKAALSGARFASERLR